LIESPLVSILIPAFNHERFVWGALNSILKQDFTNIEIILLDDGSVDGTLATALRWSHAHPEAKLKVINQANQGVARSLNRLWDQAQGEYLCFLASDDALTPTGVSCRVKYLSLHPEVGAVFGDCLVIDAENNIVYESGLSGMHCMDPGKLNLGGTALKKQIIYHWGVPGSTLMIRRNVDVLIGRFDISRSVEDWDFYLRLVSKDLLAFLPEKVSLYRVHAGASSRFNNRERIVTKELLISGLKRFFWLSPILWPIMLKRLLVLSHLLLKLQRPR
jgi:glycosyltransferase involved in cell wall biosynthesis